MSALDPLYRDTITLFNRYKNGDSYVWIPTVIRNCHFIVSKAQMVAAYGDSVQDNAQVNIIYQQLGKSAVVSGKKYVQPKAYQRLTLSQAEHSFTFAGGQEFDFVYGGVWKETATIDDDAYAKGFYHYMNTTYDDVYAITNSAMYYILPHFSITAK